jgi:antitoxin component YwqK of YwqJK toxin-antitoxin module
MKLLFFLLFLPQFLFGQYSDTCRTNEMYYGICHYDLNDIHYKTDQYTIEGKLLGAMFYTAEGKRNYFLTYYSNGNISGKASFKGNKTISVGYNCHGKRISKSKFALISDGSAYSRSETKIIYHRQWKSSCLSLTDTVWSYDSIFYFLIPDNWSSNSFQYKTQIYGSAHFSTASYISLVQNTELNEQSQLESITKRWCERNDVVNTDSIFFKNRKYLIYERNTINKGLHKYQQKRREYIIFFVIGDSTVKVMCNCPRNKTKWYKKVFIEMAKSINLVNGID